MVQDGNSAALNEVEKLSAWFIEMIVMETLRAADNVMSECLEQWSKSNKIMIAIVKQIVFVLLFIRLVPEFIKQHVMDSTIDNCRLTQVFAKMVKMNKAGVPLPPSR